MKYEIEIPDGVIPNGYEPVKFGLPQDDELFLSSHCHEVLKGCAHDAKRLILRPKWQWPEWLDADRLEWSGKFWVAKNVDTSWPLEESMIFGWGPPPDKTKIYRREEIK